MKKFLIFLGLAFLFINLIPLVFGADIGYVVKNPSSLDSNDNIIKNVLISEGHDVTILDDVSLNPDAYDLIVVSRRISDISGMFDNAIANTLFLSNSAAENSGLASNSIKITDRYVKIKDNSHFITDGFNLGLEQIYSTTSDVYYLSGCKATSSNNIVSTRSSDSDSVIFAVDSNSLLIDSGCTDRDKVIFERNLFFGLTEASKWNSDAEDLFKKSVKWLIESVPVDNDNDGYFSIDSNGNDCDDDDSNIHPGASEICDAIDNNCDGQIDENNGMCSVGNICLLGSCVLGC